MRSQIIVGYTDTEGGRDALELALTLAEADDGRAALTVASIWPVNPHEMVQPGVHIAYERALAADAESRLQGARDHCGDREDVSFVARGGTSPAHGLQLIAQELGAELIVVGRSHTGPVGRAFVGSVTEQTLHGAACAVAVAPKGYAGTEHRVALVAVAYDGSPESEHALAHALRIARDRGAALRLVRVVEPMPVAYGGMVDPYPFALRHSDVEDQLHAVVERIDGVPVTTAMVDGTAAHALAEQAADADLLVTGSRDFGPVGRILLGGTSSRLSRHCACPLLVVPRSTADAVAPALAADAAVAAP
ncbi:universal stress protein [Patulibacter sp.]|uniref:universal stress protein n=1 Tax=Patulibacter sp. TaxID=1912859 RepID=UPI0027190B5B|nr:universal stress protein [Patulibacter sp.]MDO9410875.1 universal stress protein [Patulibacter sp.]